MGGAGRPRPRRPRDPGRPPCRAAAAGRRAQRDAVVNGRDREVVDALRRAASSVHVTAVVASVQTEEAQRQYTPRGARAEGQIVY